MRVIWKSLESEGNKVGESHGHRGLYRIGANKVVARGAKNGSLVKGHEVRLSDEPALRRRQHDD